MKNWVIMFCGTKKTASVMAENPRDALRAIRAQNIRENGYDSARGMVEDGEVCVMTPDCYLWTQEGKK